MTHLLGGATTDLGCGGRHRLRVTSAGETLLDEPLADLALAWDDVSWRISALRDNPECADEEHASLARLGDPPAGWSSRPPSTRPTTSPRPI